MPATEQKVQGLPALPWADQGDLLHLLEHAMIHTSEPMPSQQLLQERARKGLESAQGICWSSCASGVCGLHGEGGISQAGVCVQCDASASMRMSGFHTARLLCVCSTCALRICLIEQPSPAPDRMLLGIITVASDMYRRRPLGTP